MAEELIISISGMRGLVGENLTDSIAVDYGRAFGTFLKNSKLMSVCIGQDSRPSGQMLKSAVTVGLCAVGIDVIDLGLVTTAPEPTAGNLNELCEVVKTKQAEIGFAQDPDADRLAIVNETGTCIGEEYTLALAAKLVARDTGDGRRDT